MWHSARQSAIKKGNVADYQDKQSSVMKSEVQEVIERRDNRLGGLLLRNFMELSLKTNHVM